MRKNPASESGMFNPRAFAAFVLASFGMAMALISFAADPPTGTISEATPIQEYDAGPFFQANQTPAGLGQLDQGPRCDAAFPCDSYTLTVSLPAGYVAAHPNASVKVTMSWTDIGAGQSDYDLYIYKGEVGDLDGSQQADYQAASGANPEVGNISPLVDGEAKYTIKIVPYQPTAETVHVKIEFLSGTGGGGLPGFGAADPTTPGVPRYQNFYAPSGTSAEPSNGEFNIGFNPKTGRIMTMNSGPVWRLTPPERLDPAQPECCEALWEDKSSETTNVGLDPILWTDQKTGRTFAANSTVGTNGVYAYTDNDGDLWVPVSASPPNASSDHETIGTGPYPASLAALSTPVNQGQAVYYCAQTFPVGAAACQRSDTLGSSYGPSTLPYDGNTSECEGIHGHVRVGPDGTVYLPVRDCGGNAGVSVSLDAGTTWTEHIVPNTATQTHGSDPTIAIGANNTVYFFYVADQAGGPQDPKEGHMHVQISTDHGETWSKDTDLGLSHGIKNAVFPEAIAGDDGRASVGFVGTDRPGDYEGASFPGVWYVFIATTYDSGDTWNVVNATPNDPVQGVGGIWQGGGSNQNRNLLDFNEITVDDKGRVLYGYSDGCVTAECIAGLGNTDYVAFMRVARQSGGRGLFAANDVAEPATPKAACLSGTRDISGSHLSWRVPDNGGSEIVKYQIFRATTAGGEGIVPLAETGGGKTSYFDATADPTVEHYFYFIKAVNTAGGGIGAPSNEVDLVVAETPVQPEPFSCSGVNVVTDAAGDGNNPSGAPGSTDQADITGISFSVNPAGDTLTTTMTLKDLSTVPSPGTTSTIYFAVWTSSDGKTYATEVDQPDPTNNLSYSWGEFDPSNNQLVSGTTHATTGTFNTGPNGTVTVDVPLSGIGSPTIPVSDPSATPAVTNPYGLTIAGEGALGAGLLFTAPVDRAPNTGFGQSWAVCLPPNAAPTAALTASPESGPAPLVVQFNAAASTDPDAGDTIASYTFDFGDGSDPVTQATPAISHTYNGAGSYAARLSVTDSRGKVSTNVARVIIQVNAALRNISTRGSVQTGDNVLIGGFIIVGDQPRTVILRAIGPSARANGQPVPGSLQDPTLELHDQNGVIAFNDDWKTNAETQQSQQTEVENTGIAPGDDHESAIVKTLSPGRYTAVMRGKGDTTGIGVVEAYDLDPAGASKLGNISTRGLVGTGDNVMIGGFVAGPENAAATRVLLRGIGPSLTDKGVAGALQDPRLELHDGNGALRDANDNWHDSPQSADIEATGIQPENDAESAILVSGLPPGGYTAILAGQGGSTGVGLVEVYNVP